MRNLMLVCAGLLVIAGIVSVNLWLDLRTERELSAALRTQPTQSGERSAVIALPVRPEVNPPAGTREPAIPQQAAGSATVPDINRTLAEEAALSASLAKDAGYRKARIAETRLTIPQEYPGLVEELGLTPEEADQLFDLLAEAQALRTIASMGSLVSQPGNPSAADVATIEELIRTRQEIRRQQDESLAALLGPMKYARFKTYEEERPARNRVTTLGRTMASAGAPLSDAQARPLTAAFAAEDKRRQEFSQQQVAARQPGEPVDQLRIDSANLEFQEQSNRRLLDAAQPHLNAAQLETLKATLDQPLARSRAALRVRREQAMAR